MSALWNSIMIPKEALINHFICKSVGEELRAGDYLGPPTQKALWTREGVRVLVLELIPCPHLGMYKSHSWQKYCFFPSMERHLQHWLGCTLLALQCRLLLSPYS